MPPNNKLTNLSTASAAGMSLAEGVTTRHCSGYAASLAKAAKKLGVENPKELDSVLISVDRQNLAHMIRAESIVDGINDAEYFFDSVMTATETYILWPFELKMDVKMNKDPQVRVVGRTAEVANAKELILARLKTREHSVTMKMDVSYMDHSNIIGSGGQHIKRIMENSATYVHFPEVNCTNPKEKSNNVAVYGSLEGVERARGLIRLAATLVFAFEMLIVPGRAQPHQHTDYVRMIERKFKVRVFFSPTFKSVLILVKGYERQAAEVQEATQMLVKFSCGDMASQILVQMHLEISPQHQGFVKGNKNQNMLDIMEHTKTTILFPHLWDAKVRACKRSQITIRGNADGVYKARKLLLGNLPITLVFDLPANRIEVSTDLMMDLNNKYGVAISLSPKQKQGTLPVISIKGAEKCLSKIYEAHDEILRLSKTILEPAITETKYLLYDQELSSGYSAGLNPSISPISSDGTLNFNSITSSDDENLTHYSADSTNSSESADFDRMGRRSSDGVGRLSLGASRRISPMQLSSEADSFRNIYCDENLDHMFDFDMRRSSLDFKDLERPSISSDGLQTPTANWMVLDDMIRQCGDMSVNASPHFGGSAAPDAGRRVSSQW